LRSSRSAFPCIIELPGLSKRGLRQPLYHAAAGLVNLHRWACEHRRSDGWTLLSALAPSKMNSRQTLRIKPALDDQAERVFVAVGVDCEGGDQHQVVFDLQTVDRSEASQPATRPTAPQTGARPSTSRCRPLRVETSLPSGQASPRTAAGTLRREVLRIGEHSIHECDNSVTSLPAFCPDHSPKEILMRGRPAKV
jgi:hypothetical protein